MRKCALKRRGMIPASERNLLGHAPRRAPGTAASARFALFVHRRPGDRPGGCGNGRGNRIRGERRSSVVGRRRCTVLHGGSCRRSRGSDDHLAPGVPPGAAGRVGSGERLLVYLCLDRARGNLALARRELAAARLGEQPEPAVAAAGTGAPASRLTSGGTDRRCPGGASHPEAAACVALMLETSRRGARGPAAGACVSPAGRRAPAARARRAPAAAPAGGDRPGSGPAVGERRRHDAPAPRGPAQLGVASR